MSEERRIMDWLGRGSLEGEVKGSHLGSVLTYLKKTKQESVYSTLAKLSLVCGANKRYIRENYLEGLIEFGIIELIEYGHNTYWKWNGIKAVNGKEPIGKMIEPSRFKKIKTKKVVEHENYCLSCGKEIPKNKKFCNEECLRDSYKKKEGNVNAENSK